MTALHFSKLNQGWNAEPNAVNPRLQVSGRDLLLLFELNYFTFRPFKPGDIGVLRFVNCSKFRTDWTNDEAWFRGTCRYSRLAPAWGEFYEISGPDPTLASVDDWIEIEGSAGSRHFLFYFRDELFECFAAEWLFDVTPNNALLSLSER